MRSTPPRRRFRVDPSIRILREHEARERELRAQQEREARQLIEENRERIERRRQEQLQADASNQRISALENQWRVFVASAQEAQARMQQAQRYSSTLKILEDIERSMDPPAEPDSGVVYVSENEWGSDRLGDPDFNAKLFAKPRRWW